MMSISVLLLVTMTTQIIFATLIVVAVGRSMFIGSNINQLDNHLLVIPEPHLNISHNVSDVRFLLWTRSNAEDDAHYRLFPNDLDNLHQSPFDASLPTYFMYHGFSDQGMCGWIRNAKTELLKQYDCNVISVDWEKLVISPWYNFAVENVYKTANYTAGLIDWLGSTVGLSASQLHITGHSLGAHTAGLTAKYVTSGTVARVTGLDPAGPFFYEKPADERIDKSDAAFVDIIHANSGSIFEGCIGMIKAVGHVDFYPNGGQHQPGCVITPEEDLDDWMDLFGGCSHARATEMWVESLTAVPPSLTFTSWPCSDWDTFFTGDCPSCGDSCLNMGFHVQQGLTGLYYLRTNPTSPFALGDIQ